MRGKRRAALRPLLPRGTRRRQHDVLARQLLRERGQQIGEQDLARSTVGNQLQDGDREEARTALSIRDIRRPQRL